MLHVHVYWEALRVDKESPSYTTPTMQLFSLTVYTYQITLKLKVNLIGHFQLIKIQT